MANFDVIVVGNALEDFGLEAKNTISGIGLVTYGFLWDCADIWNVADEDVTTTWTDCPIYTGANIETCPGD